MNRERTAVNSYIRKVAAVLMILSLLLSGILRLPVGAVSSGDGSINSIIVDTQISLTAGSSRRIRAWCGGKKISWKALNFSSDNSYVATVSRRGKIIAKHPGTTLIDISSRESSASAQITVRVGAPARRITMRSSEKTLRINNYYMIHARVKPRNTISKKLKYTSTDTNVAVVNSKGKVTAVGNGSCSIIIETTDGSGIKAEFRVNVDGKADPEDGDNLFFKTSL